MGKVEDIIWDIGHSRSDLPLAILVSIQSYHGPTLWRTEPSMYTLKVYMSGDKRHKQTASDALVFILNATMSLPRFDF